MKSIFAVPFLLILLLLGSSLSAAEGNGKSFGIAVNPALVPLKWVSADLCFWNIDRSTEFNMPFQFTKNPSFITPSKSDILYLSGGLNARRFFNGEQKGFFAELGFQYNHLKVEGSAKSDSEDSPFEGTFTSRNPAVLFGVGYRLLTVNNFFWGCDFAIGRQWGRETPFIGVENIAYSINIFKFGYAF